MAINIKNERVCELVRRAARETGRPQVSVLEEALEQYLAALGTDEDAVAEVLAEVDALMTPEKAAAMDRTSRSLYDEDGLPA